MYTLKNKSNSILDVMGKKIHPSEELQVTNLNPYKRLIQTGFLKVINTEQVKLQVLPKRFDRQTISNINSNHKVQQLISKNFPVKVLQEESKPDANDEINNDGIDNNETDDTETNESNKSNVNDEKLNSIMNDLTLRDERINNKIEQLQQSFINQLQMVTEQNDKIKKEIIQITKQAINPINQQEIISSLFRFYMDKNITSQDLDNIKYFFLNVSELKHIPEELKQELLNATSYEEVISSLLNSIYPYLFNQ